MGFTREELAAMRAADAEIEESFLLSREEREEARLRDRDSSEQLRTHQEVKELQYHREYYYKNRERINAQRREYYRENRERILANRAKERRGVSEAERDPKGQR